MDALLLYGLLAAVGVTILRALFPPAPPPPQVVYVHLEPQQDVGPGCLPLLVVVVIALVVVALITG
mgnify:CR=1 FL=1